MATTTAVTPTHHTSGATVPAGRVARWTGRVLSGSVIAFLGFDVVGKLLRPEPVVEATVRLGFDEGIVVVLGVLLAIGVVLYAVPRTAFVGALWTTAYLGGAVCANVRAEQPLLGFVLAPVYVAVVMWAGLYLRSPRFRAFLRSGI